MFLLRLRLCNCLRSFAHNGSLPSLQSAVEAFIFDPSEGLYIYPPNDSGWSLGFSKGIQRPHPSPSPAVLFRMKLVEKTNLLSVKGHYGFAGLG